VGLAVAVLQEFDWIGSETTPASETRGRPRTSYWVNTKLFENGQPAREALLRKGGVPGEQGTEAEILPVSPDEKSVEPQEATPKTSKTPFDGFGGSGVGGASSFAEEEVLAPGSPSEPSWDDSALADGPPTEVDPAELEWRLI
jgi:hypothetical protein